MVTALPRCGRDSGFTYLFVLFAVAIMGAGLAAVGELWQTHRLRASEVELLFVGDQYRRAIGAYYLNRGGCGPERNRYPRQLADLLKDPRCPANVRYLRTLYADPVTNKPEWGLVRAPDGGIAGVYSLSEQRPFKEANFRFVDRDFEGKRAYKDWQFVHRIAQAGTIPAAPGQATLQGVSSPASPGIAVAPSGAGASVVPGGMGVTTPSFGGMEAPRGTGPLATP